MGELRDKLRFQIKEVEVHYLKIILFNIKIGVLWMLRAIVVGLVAGVFSSAFTLGLAWVTRTRNENPYLLFLLPAGGLLIVWLYRLCGIRKDEGTNLLITAVHESRHNVPVYLAPLIFGATLITHLFGGSAGREGAALQMGGSIGNTLGRLFRLSEGDRKILMMSGMSAAFSAVFGTPLAAAIFPMEMISVGIMHYAALVPCVFASIVANQCAIHMGIRVESYQIAVIPPVSFESCGKLILLGVCCAVLSIVFCMFLRGAGYFYNKCFKNPYIRVAAGGVIVIALTLLVGNFDYNGAGTELIERAIVEENVPSYAFLLKMLFTSLTLAAGFKGGEIVPAFCTGAVFGCVFGNVLGISPSLCAALGMTAVFCGVTNCPITSMLVGFELFGFDGAVFILLVISVSYLLSGYHGLYREQIIVYSKYHPKYINRLSGEESFDGADYEE